MSYKILIVGCGGIGARHLQGVLKSSLPLSIDVVDIDKESLTNASKLAGEVTLGNAQTQVHYKTVLPEGQDYSVAIVATTSHVRLHVMRELLNSNHVTSLILEKFLFSFKNEYQQAKNLLKQHSVKAYVNCPRRMNPNYQALKKELKKHSNWQFSVEGNEWGLACNAVHFLDIYRYLTEEQQPLVLEGKGLEPYIFESKRGGYKEVFGRITSSSKELSILCGHSEKMSLQVKLTSEHQEVLIDELAGTIEFNGDIQEIRPFETVYQSNLSYQFVEQSIREEPMTLTPFEESADTHLALLDTLEKHFQLHGDTSRSREYQIT
ncbi:Gfo/Idh/MocA family oxidoreductase [Pseudoalteromonas sp. MMG013]|uniref:Gfo/Idh/MocA family oxidoreductase n=1 Tax=Pseudoalteromonas sp. MMG013 TaxID=2822687 RepID=UPI001B3851E1|nr:Gfo/Idh/MocA family oxidoreductase [Pseudoalteromonas sp. MMG013]MBQ4861995.1 Gfo/Idh/MocA family oxidoreductase [Pseudoalteromonas sp. MMG013]